MQQWHDFLDPYQNHLQSFAEQATDTQPALLDLSHMGLLRVSGDGAKNLLQGQLTCDINDITLTQSRLGAHCNPQGRILSLAHLFYFQDSYYLQLPRDVIPIALAALQKYAVFYKVDLQDASDTLIQIGYRGPHAPLQALTTELPTETNAVTQTQHLLINNLSSQISYYEVIGDFATITNLWTSLAKESLMNTTNISKYWRIQMGLPTIYANTSGKLLPHEINLPDLNAVSFNKGCYTGQEIIARMHYRGQSKKQMVRARVHTSTLPQPGADLFQDNHACGIIIDSCWESATVCQLLLVTAEKNLQATTALYLDVNHEASLDILS
jgi:folate-binding protein YgfZ